MPEAECVAALLQRLIFQPHIEVVSLKISLTVMSVPLGDLHLEVAKLTSNQQSSLTHCAQKINEENMSHFLRIDFHF